MNRSSSLSQECNTDGNVISIDITAGKNEDKHKKQLSSSSAKLKDVEIWIRITPNEEYIKVVVFKGRVVGALLLGDTDCEEVFENLILNKIDVSDIGEAILDPDLDLEGYFD